jgi:hypothetical protein
MSNQLEVVEAQALRLSPEERVQLADRLVASLFKDQEIESGRATLIPAAEAIARARAAIK